MTRHIFVSFFLFSFCALAVSPLAAAQAKDNLSAGDSAKPASVSGKWQVLLEGRLAKEPGVLQLQQDGSKLTGTFQDSHGLSPVSGTVVETQVSFDVQFQGQHPFTIRFTGTADNSADGIELKGSSQAILPDGGKVFLGHAGEVVHPEHPWTAKRIPNQPAQSGETGSNPSPSARN
ncbi:MAG TPA: hypothetical protein VK706_17155 [Candidatus Sulfotelmatobacter sp.]|nr:hypothetical protein [Candidatus Sulfotelmatobacter sp.]